ncbi:unnamed protein product [Prorocentrum cordatum]|uniref:Uncharacterized protein n=1 Tax=Prorocentrum cordatum TaxID=2364126 RepID=A0ABN9SSX0_9DINO|nr:unnamed protein product [Polarella glacialis]
MAAGKHSLFDETDFYEPSESRLDSWDDDSNEGYILTKDCDHARRPQGHSVYRIETVVRNNRDGKTISVKHLASEGGYYEHYVHNIAKKKQPIWLHLCVSSSRTCRASFPDAKQYNPRPETIHVDKWAPVTVQEIKQIPWAKKHLRMADSAPAAGSDGGRGPRGKPGGLLSTAADDEAANARAAKAQGRNGNPRQADNGGRGERCDTERGGNRPEGGDLVADLTSLEKSLDGDFEADDLRKRANWLKDKYMKISGKRGATAAPAAERPAKRQTLDDILSKRVAETRAKGEDARASRSDGRRDLHEPADPDPARRRVVQVGSDEPGEEYGGPCSGAPQERIDIQTVWKKNPGKLSGDTLQRMSRTLGGMVPSDLHDSSSALARPIVQAYLHQIIYNHHSKSKMGLRNSRELETWALAADCLLRGELGSVRDVIMQRVKALERYLVDDNWSVARWFELIPTGDSQLTPRSEAVSAHRLEKSERDLRKGAG